MMFLCCCDCSADRVSSCVNQLTEQSLSVLDDCQSSAPQQITSTSVTVATAKSIPRVCGIGVEASEGSVGSAVYKCPNCHFVTLRGGSILHQCSSSHRAERGESGLPHHQISRSSSHRAERGESGLPHHQISRSSSHRAERGDSPLSPLSAR